LRHASALQKLTLGEQHNLAAAHPAIYNDLKQHLLEWFKRSTMN
jgi:hypothetical protein